MKHLSKGLPIFAFWVLATNSFAQLSVNAGLVSDYVWRGYTQNDGDPSLSAGVNYAGSNGFYGSLWAGQVVDGLDIEIDGIVGWQTEKDSGLSLGAGYIYYAFTDDFAGEADPNFGELFGSVGYRWFTLKYSYDENENGYLEGNVATELAAGITLGLHYGDYDFDAGPSSQDWQVSLSKDWKSLSFLVAYADLSGSGGIEDEDSAYAGVTWSWSNE